MSYCCHLVPWGWWSAQVDQGWVGNLLLVLAQLYSDLGFHLLPAASVVAVVVVVVAAAAAAVVAVLVPRPLSRHYQAAAAPVVVLPPQPLPPSLPHHLRTMQLIEGAFSSVNDIMIKAPTRGSLTLHFDISFLEW